MHQTILPLLLCTLVAPCFSYTYPIFGTKRYQRAQYQPPPPPPPVPSYQYSQYQAPQYYDPMIPQSIYSDDSYYYTPRHPSYGLPTYHGEYRPRLYFAHTPSYSYTDDHDANPNPLDDLHEEMLQEDALDRGDFVSTGQEVWYETPGRNADTLAKANAAFLRNLMIYNSQYGRPNVPTIKEPESSSNSMVNNYNEYDYDDSPIDWYDSSPSSKSAYNSYSKVPLSPSTYTQNIVSPSSVVPKLGSKSVEDNDSDEDVRELKALVNKHRKDHDSLYSNQDWIKQNDVSFSPAQYDDEYQDDAWINWDSKRSTLTKNTLPSKSNTKKPIDLKIYKPKMDLTTPSIPTISSVKVVTPKLFSTASSSKNMDKHANLHGGQKEIVLPRPAVPVRHPFQQSPILNTLEMPSSQTHEDKKQQPGAIYDTIKQILAMEQRLGKVSDIFYFLLT